MRATAISHANKYSNMGGSLSLRGAVVVGANEYSSARLWAFADSLCTLLRPVIDRNSRVVLALADIGAFAASALAIRSLGAVAVLLSSRQPGAVSRDADELTSRLRDCHPDVTIIDDGHLRVLGEPIEALGVSICRVPDGLAAPHLTVRQRVEGHLPNPAQAALIAYTSGSRSDGLGVVLSEATLEYLLRMNQRVNRWDARDCLLAALPLSHLAGFINLMGACTYGARVVASPPFMWLAEVLEVCIRERVTVMGLVPYYMGQLVRSRKLGSIASLRLIVCSAAPIKERDVRTALADCPGLKIINAYGLTEAFRSLVRWPECRQDQITALGTAMPDIEIELRDESGAALLDPEATGVAWLRGPNVMLGYFNAPRDTRARMRDGWLCTGDTLRRTADGWYWLKGRRADTIDGGGEQRNTHTIERRIATTCPVIDVCVVGRPGGDGDDNGIDEVIAVVVPESGARLALDDIRRACAGHMHAAFVPSRLLVVDTFPRTRSGKVDRRRVMELIED